MTSQPNEFGKRAWAALVQDFSHFAAVQPQERFEGVLEGAFLAFRKAKPNYGGALSAESVNQIPPRLEQVQAYFTELGSTCEAQDFMDHYDMVGWVCGTAKLKMKDWKAACRLWHRRQGRSALAPRTTPGQASLFALQAQLKVVEQEINDILYPGGTSFRVTPEEGTPKHGRLHQLIVQRRNLKAQIDRFAS